ncbi:MAG: CoA transferase [Pseudomonadota bacterium]
MARALEGIRVLDLTHVLAGPYCTFLLAGQGAEVIKIEDPANPDPARGRGPDPALNAAGRGLTYQVQGAGKRALTLNLKAPAGAEIFRQLVATADVVVENYRAGALDALGLGAEALQALKPDLIHCSITGFGAGGERMAIRAYDNVIQAAAGVIAQSGGQKPGLSFVDYATGQAAAFAIASALLRRATGGGGQRLDVSMYDTALSMMLPEIAAVLHPSGETRGKEPGISAYETADGALMLGAFTPAQNRRLWSALAAEGHEAGEMADTPDWPALWSRAEAMRPRLAKIFRTKSATAWQDWLHTHDLPGERVRSLDEAVADPHLAARGSLATLGDAHTIAAPFTANEDGPHISHGAPAFSADTDALLSDLGYAPDQIATLRAEGTI